MKSINKNLEIRLYPKEDNKDLIHQFIGDARFVWNKVLDEYNKLYEESKNAAKKIHPTLSLFNRILMDLKEENNFLRQGESTSQQQELRDLIKAFEHFFNDKFGFPNHKSRKHSKQSFRVQNNHNSIRLENNKIRIPKIGFIKFKTSKDYKEILKNSIIQNATIELRHGKYYAVINILTNYTPWPLGHKDTGIDRGLKTLATLSDGIKIANLDLTKEEKMIKKYQRQLQRKEYDSNNYQKTLKKLWKWTDKKNNKTEDYLHKITTKIVQDSKIICMETLNIKGMKQNHKLAPKLQRISMSKFKDLIKYKCDWNDREFIQIDMFFPSSKMCHVCHEKYEELTLDIREWTCKKCNTTHDRDINAAINILEEGLKILKKNK